MISVVKSKKKIFVETNLCNNENKTDVMSCILIGLILLKIKDPRIMSEFPRAFQRGGIPSFQVLHDLKSFR
jgi:hypothetical protein